MVVDSAEDKGICTLVDKFEFPFRKGLDLDSVFLSDATSKDAIISAFRKNAKERYKEDLKKQSEREFKHLSFNDALALTDDQLLALLKNNLINSTLKYQMFNEIARHGLHHVWLAQHNVLNTFKAIVRNLGAAEDNVSHVIHILTHKQSPEYSFLLIDNADPSIVEKHKELIAKHPRVEVKLRLTQKGFITQRAYDSSNSDVIIAMCKSGHINPVWYKSDDELVRAALVHYGQAKFLRNDESTLVRREYTKVTGDVSGLLTTTNHRLIEFYVSYLDRDIEQHKLVAKRCVLNNINNPSSKSLYTLALLLQRGFGIGCIKTKGPADLSQFASNLNHANQTKANRTLRNLEKYVALLRSRLNKINPPDEYPMDVDLLRLD